MKKDPSMWTSYFEAVLKTQEVRLWFLRQHLHRKGILTYEHLSELPRGSPIHLLIQSFDLLDKGHELCERTLRQIKLSHERLTKQ